MLRLLKSLFGKPRRVGQTDEETLYLSKYRIKPIRIQEKYQLIQLRNDSVNLRVWIFAEPFSEAIEPMWGMASLTPPKTLIQGADDSMELNGQLVNAMPDIFAFDMLPRMTDTERRSLIDNIADGAQWMRYSGNTEMATYNVVVMLS